MSERSERKHGNLDVGSLAGVIEDHRQALKAFELSVNGADHLHPDYAGDAGVRRYETCQKAEISTFNRLLKLPARDREERWTKVNYLTSTNVMRQRLVDTYNLSKAPDGSRVPMINLLWSLV